MLLKNRYDKVFIVEVHRAQIFSIHKTKKNIQEKLARRLKGSIIKSRQSQRTKPGLMKVILVQCNYTSSGG